MTNNLKNELEKIKMSKDTKERIIAACENSVRNRSISKTDNDEYTDHVFTAERIKPKNRLLRSISAVAACAVIAGGIGTTGYLLNRNGSVPATETETTEPVEVVQTEITPFGDFTTYDFVVSRGKRDDDQIEPFLLNSEEKENVAAYLNNFNWGEEITFDDLTDEDLEATDYSVYIFQWEKDNVTYYLGVCEMGYAVYAELTYDDGVQGIKQPDYQKICRLDFEAFDSGMCEILGVDASGSITTNPFGDFTTFDFSISASDIGNWTYDRVILDKLADFFNNFDWGEEFPDGKVPEEYENESYDRIYNISWDSDEGFSAIAVAGNGVVTYNTSHYDDNEPFGSFETETRAFYIDFEAFDKGVQEILDTGEAEDILQLVDDMKQEYLNGFDDVQLVVCLRDENDNEIDMSEESKEKFQAMIEGEFKYKSMLRSDPIDPNSVSEDYAVVYGVDLKYMSGGKEVLGRYYNIVSDGSVILSDCEYSTSKDDVWTGPYHYYIDLNDFYAKLAECGLR